MSILMTARVGRTTRKFVTLATIAWCLGRNVEISGAQTKICKFDEDEGIAYGWAIVSTIDGEPHFDLQEHHIPDVVMSKGVSDFMLNVRVNKDMHDGESIGTVVHSFPLTKELKDVFGIQAQFTGWMVGVKPNPESLAKFKSGEFTGFSIGGDGELQNA